MHDSHVIPGIGMSLRDRPFGVYGPPSAGDGDPAAGANAIVLAGSHFWGSGTFERLLRGPLLPVAQHPLISYPLRWLAAGGVRSATICAGQATGAVREHFDGAGTPGLDLRYYVDAQPRGPAGCARDACIATDAERFVLVEGAVLPALDLRALLAAHRRSGAVATTVVEIDRRRQTAGGHRPATPGGVYVFEREVLESVPATGFQDIKQGLLERLYASNARVMVHEVQGVSPRILDFATYAAVSSWLVTSARHRREQFDGWIMSGETLRHPRAQIHPSARLMGPMLIGPDARIDANAVLVGPLSLGADSHVEAGAVLTRSIVWERCTVGAEAIVDACVLADRALVAPRRQLSGAVVLDAADHRSSSAPIGTPIDDASIEHLLAPAALSAAM